VSVAQANGLEIDCRNLELLVELIQRHSQFELHSLEFFQQAIDFIDFLELIRQMLEGNLFIDLLAALILVSLLRS